MLMLKEMEYVYAVYEEQSFSKAARKLYLSQPALSAAVRRAEAEIHTPIFDRSTNPIRLTAAGAYYIDAVKRILDIRQEMESYFDALAGECRGSVRVGGGLFLLRPCAARYRGGVSASVPRLAGQHAGGERPRPVPLPPVRHHRPESERGGGRPPPVPLHRLA